MAKPTIYHNPRCSKSRQTLALLQEHGHAPQVIEYLKTPPTEEQLQSILTALKMAPLQLMRKGESVFKDMGLGGEQVSDEQRLAAMVEHPILIERPIVVNGNKAAIGRPPESVLDIL